MTDLIIIFVAGYLLGLISIKSTEIYFVCNLFRALRVSRTHVVLLSKQLNWANRANYRKRNQLKTIRSKYMYERSLKVRREQELNKALHG